MLPLSLSFIQAAFINFESRISGQLTCINQSTLVQIYMFPSSSTLRIHLDMFIRFLYVWACNILQYFCIDDNSSQTVFVLLIISWD